MLESLFNKDAGLQVKFGKFLRPCFFTEHLWWLTASKVFCKDFVSISYENASFCVLEA